MKPPVPKRAAKAKELTAHEQFADLHSDTQDRLAALAHEWAAGEWSAGTWAQQMDAILLDAHTQAVVIGRQHAGDDAPLEADDQAFAVPIVAEESRYLEGFREQLARGDYDNEDGTRDGERAAARAALYSDRITGTANAAWTSTLPEETLVWWDLADTEDACPDCPPIAEGSPYPASAMDAWPGSNQTACMQNCRCAVRTEDGQRGFVTP